MTKVTRIAVWGIGVFGTLFVHLARNRKDMQIVAAYAHANSSKVGKDVGEVAAGASLGIKVTSNKHDLVAAKPDCVVHFAKDDGQWGADADLLFLLESGCNVVSALPYCNLAAWRGKDVEDRFDAAAKRGGATFFVTGVDPDFAWERNVANASGLCADISHIHVKEVFSGHKIGEGMFPAFGFGTPVEEARKNQATAGWVLNYIAPSMMYTCEKMGRKLDRVVGSVQSEAAPFDIDTPFLTVKKGTVGLFVIHMEGYIGDKIFAEHDVVYHLGKNRPADARADECWIVSIDGKPSVRVTVEPLVSIQNGGDRYADDPTHTTVGYYVCVGAILNAILAVVAAPPGIKEPSMPELMWKAPAG